jgi:hypothetical protein
MLGLCRALSCGLLVYYECRVLLTPVVYGQLWGCAPACGFGVAYPCTPPLAKLLEVIRSVV